MDSVGGVIQANDTRVWFSKKTSENFLMIYLLNSAETRNLWHSKIKSSLRHQVFSWGKLPKCRAQFRNLSNTVSITEVFSENSQPCSIKEVIFRVFLGTKLVNDPLFLRTRISKSIFMDWKPASNVFLVSKILKRCMPLA